jgi:DNA polymerase III alpha subunit
MRKRIDDKTKELEGTFRTYSLHCGGIVYYPDGVPDDKVLSKAKSSIVKQITLNKEDVAKEKHFKIDILSSRGLAVLVDICGPKVEFENPIHDENVFDMLCRGDNIGITLAESPLMRKTIMKFKPRSIDDLAVCLSIIRPAAKSARDAEPEDLPDPEEDNDADIFIYDDDAIKIISRAIGCSEGDADKHRRIFAKSDKKGIEEFRKILEDINIGEEESEQLLACLKQLTKYSFCKSHAFSYAQLVYQLAYYKYHKPQEFWLAVLKHSEGSYKKWVHLYEARVSGLLGTAKKEVSIYATNRQNKIYDIQNPAEQMKKFGYWTFVGDLFFPNCYCFKVDGTDDWKINGIIASIRLIKKSETQSICILFLGTGKKQYTEVLVPNVKFVHSKWIGCKLTAKIKESTMQIFDATKYFFY